MTRKNDFVASWLSPLVSVVRVAEEEICTMPAELNVLLVAATEPEVEPPITPIMVLLATNFCATVCAADGPCSTGASPGTSRTLRPIVFGSVLIASLAHESCSWPMKPAPPVRGASIPIARFFEQLIALERWVDALAGAADTVAASAVAAATAANSGNDLAFLMYELLLGGSGYETSGN